MARKKDAPPVPGDDEDEASINASETDAGDEGGSAAEDADSADAADAEESAGEEVSFETSDPVLAEHIHPNPAGNLHSRLEKAVRAVHSGPQDAHFALHTVEMLTGRLKSILPSAIGAVDDEDLKTSLSALQNLL